MRRIIAHRITLHILDDCRGPGIGARLVHEATRGLIERGKETLQIWTLSENPYRPFYEAPRGTAIGERNITMGDQTLREMAQSRQSLRSMDATR